MLKQFIEYEDLDDNRQTCTLFFNLRRTEIAQDMELEKLQERVEIFQREVIDRERSEMSIPEVREFLDIIKVLVRASYGVRDGQQFLKSQALWDEFVQTGKYDGLIWWLFDDPQRANDFLAGVWPKEIREQVREQIATVRPIEDVRLKEVSFTDAEHSAPHTSVTVEKTDEELLAMDPEKMTADELKRAFRLKVRRGAAQD